MSPSGSPPASGRRREKPELVDAKDGRLLVRGRTHQHLLPSKQKGGGYFVETSTAAKKKARPHFTVATGADRAPAEKTVEAGRWGMLSGRDKKAHTDAEEEEKLGSPNIVVQRMTATCFVAQVMLDTLAWASRESAGPRWGRAGLGAAPGHNL